MRKKFKLKNYTSTVPVSKSISEIEELLSQAGADMILKQYEDGEAGSRVVTGFTFTIKDNEQTAMFKLPSNTREFAAAMLAEKKKLHKGTRALVAEQAERTAWKVLNDWVAIQLTLIRVHQIHPFQVFMGYLYDPRSKEGYFQKVQREGFTKLLGDGRER
jgi:hypothetical protein